MALFEMGRVFLAPTSKEAVLPEERLHLAAVLTGDVRRRPVEPDRPIDAYDAVDIVNEVFAALEIADAKTQPATRPGFDPARAAAVVVDGRDVGVLGDVPPAALAALDLAPPVVGLEVDLDGLLGARRRDRTFRAPPPYPPSSIDLAFVVDEDVPAGAVAATLRDASGGLLEDVRLFDVFRSEALGPGRKSLAFTLRLRARDRTLTDDEVGEIRQRCVDAVAREHGGELRG